MLNQIRREAFDLRLQGLSWDQIGEALGYSGSTVHADLMQCLKDGPRLAKCKNPVLRDLLENQYQGCVKAFAEDCGIYINIMYELMNGRRRVTPEYAKRIRRATGADVFADPRSETRYGNGSKK